jgi:predicted dehydrogenase
VGVGFIGLVHLDASRRHLRRQPKHAVRVRQKPSAGIQTFRQANGKDRTPVEITTKNTAHVLLRFEQGAHGSVLVSQVSAGHRNRVGIEVAGSRASLSWNSDQNKLLWIGHREQPNQILVRDPTLMETPYSSLPGGRAGGFAESFKLLFERAYGVGAAGAPRTEESYPTFEAGHWGALVCDAVASSNEADRWVEAAPVPLSNPNVAGFWHTGGR